MSCKLNEFTITRLICTGSVFVSTIGSANMLRPEEKYQVKMGDCLSMIAYKQSKLIESNYSETYKLIQILNPEIKDVDFIRADQIISVPLKTVTTQKNVTYENRPQEVIVEEGDTLLKIIEEHWGEVEDRDELIEIYLSINPKIRNKDLIIIGDTVKHPSLAERESVTASRSFASDDYSELEKKNASLGKDEESHSHLIFHFGRGTLSIDSENIETQKKAKLISEVTPIFGFGFNHINENNKFEIFANYTNYKVKAGPNFKIKNGEFSLFDYFFSYYRIINKTFSFGFKVGAGEEYFNRGVNESTLEFFKTSYLQYGPNLGINIYETNKFQIEFNAAYAIKEISSFESETLKEASELHGRLSFKFPWRSDTVGSTVYYKQNEKESEVYKQTERSTGILVFYNMEF